MRMRFLYIAVHVLIWGGLGFILAPLPLGLGLFQISLFEPADTLPFFLYGMLLNGGMFYAYAHLALPRFVRTKAPSYLFLTNVAFLTGFVLLESTFDFFYMKGVYLAGGYDRDWTAFGEWVTTNLVITGAFMLAANFYGFTFGWFKSQQQQRELEQAKLQAELSALKHQINPHFLFNILNGLYGLAFRNDDEATAEGIAKLSQMMRYLLYESNDAQVPLEQEILYLENYIDLQKLRLNEATRVHFRVEGDTTGKQIVPMILIPFVENAFKHGISSVRPAEIVIALHLKDRQLVFQVENPIQRPEASPHGPVGGIGLQNVRQRLALLYPDAYRLEAGAIAGRYIVNLTLHL
ncbi:MAG: sensor histidine kinase [Bacteroidetes bacterium]|nr:MAG: sensor histidine kinase [Bacteroidota bacterium]